jgi:hypothetical protein
VIERERLSVWESKHNEMRGPAGLAAGLLVAAILLGPECSTPAAAKLVQGQLSLSSFITDQYISKFSFSEAADGHIRVRALLPTLTRFVLREYAQGSFSPRSPPPTRLPHPVTHPPACALLTTGLAAAWRPRTQSFRED